MDRNGPVFFDTDTVTVPGPLPLAPDAITAHDAGLAAVHAQPLAVDTVKDTEPAARDVVRLVGETLNVHGAGWAACVTVKFHPPAWITPLRVLGVPFAPTVNETLPDPTPDAPAVTASHPAWLTAVH